MARKKNAESESFDWSEYSCAAISFGQLAKGLSELSEMVSASDPDESQWVQVEGIRFDAEEIEHVVRITETMHRKLGCCIAQMRAEVNKAKVSEVLRFCS